jgi:bifunctional non-homologous end joining protein LigD
MATKRALKKQPPKKEDAADLVDEQLARYRSMRDFNVTAEPAGGKSKNNPAKKPQQGLPFVIQKHAASHLHYDFRLGWNGVLKSWAVAKGPSYNPKDKRLAVQVEDHPMEYGGFEGVIPKGQYGGGTVMLWDSGWWEPQSGHADVDAGLRDGSLKFTMHGTKMKGNWALVRMGGKAANESKPNWLLIKEHDPLERGDGDKPVTEAEPNSVVTDRSIEEIAQNEDHVWNSKETAKGNAWQRMDAVSPEVKRSRTPASSDESRNVAPDLSAYPREKLPDFIPPQLALQSETPIDKPDWLHELKLDGYRIEARKSGRDVRLLTRTGLDWTHRMKAIAAEIAKLAVESAIFDGEVVVLAENGTTSFADLQASFREGERHTLTYFIFDLMHVNGHNLRGVPLIKRKAILSQVLGASDHSEEILRMSEHIESKGGAVFQNACELHAEGIVSKKASSKYTSGRTGDWLKVKCVHDQEFVIGGFTLPSNGILGVGALLLGYHDEQGRLIYAGRTGTGFTQKTHRLMRDQLDELRSKSMPFEAIPAVARRGAIWVTPKLVAQVNFATWTTDHLVRQAAFKGLREDKPASEVRREEVESGIHKSPRARAEHRGQNELVAKRVSANAEDKPPKAAEGESSKHAPVRLTHADKVLDSESGLTKQQLADYYWQIADHMLPQIVNRPLSLVRCPEGSTQPCFFQKHTNAMLPPGIETIDVPDKKTGKMEPYITLSTREALAGLAQMGVLEIHPWGCRNDDLEHPDRIIIDLDPDESISWKTLAAAAEETREVLKKLGLESFLKSTGGKGLHVVMPVEPEHEWAVMKQFAHAIALHLERQQPSLYLTKMSKAARRGRIFVDYLRNERGATAVAAFSPRARAGAPVSIPLAWKELSQESRPIFYAAEYKQWEKRLRTDPWSKLPSTRQRIDLDKVSTVLG